MSITPMDLQTLFVRLGEVGKEQNHLKEAVASQQAAEAKHIKEEELRQDTTVNKTEEDREVQKLNDEDQTDNRRDRGTGKEKEKENEKTLLTKKVFKDPEIGSHIDISG